MRFCPGTIVKIMAGATAEYVGRIGVVIDFDEEENLYNNTSVAVLDGDGEIELVMEFEEEDLIGCDLSNNVNLAIASHVYGNLWRMEQALTCKHLHIEKLDKLDDDSYHDYLKCVDCGLKTSDMDSRTEALVTTLWEKRIVP